MNFYSFLYGGLYYQTYTYIVFEPKEQAIYKLFDVFANKANAFKNPNLKGEFGEDPDTFFITQKWSLTYIRNFETKPAYLKGRITEVSENETKIEMAVRPNSVYLIIASLFVIVVAVRIVSALIKKEYNDIAEALLLLIPIPFLALVGKFSSNNLRKLFENYLNILPEVKNAS